MSRLALVAIVLLAAVLRFAGLGFGLPHAEARPDEITIAFQAMKFGTGDLNPHSFNYPSFHKYLCFALFGGHYVYGQVVGLYETKDDFLRAFFNGAVDFRLLMRCLSASLGTLTVLALAWSPGRLWAAGFLAVAMLAVRDSHFGVTDTPMVALAVGCVVACDRALHSGRLRDVLLAAVIGGLAASTKYNAALLAIPIAVAAGPRRMVGAGAAMIAAFVAGSPYVLLDFPSFWRDFSYEANHLSEGHFVDIGVGWLQHAKTLGLTQGWAFVLLGVGGIVTLAQHNPRRAVLWFGFPLAYYLAIGKGETAFFRYILPVLPFLCVGAGIVVRALSFRLSWLVGIAVSLVPFWGSVQVNRLFLAGDTRDAMATWIEANVPSEAVIVHAGAYTGAPMLQRNVLNQTREYVAKQGRADSAGFRKPDDARYYEPRRPMYDVLFVRKPGIDFASQVDFDGQFTLEGVALSAPFYLEVETYALEHYAHVPQAVRQFAQGCLPVHEERATTAHTGLFDQQDALYLPAARAWAYTRMGPDLSLYLCTPEPRRVPS